VVEAYRNCPVVVEFLQDLVEEITLAHPYKVKVIVAAVNRFLYKFREANYDDGLNEGGYKCIQN